jgi:uncharacterized LabA/DUF88 family protein
MRETTNELKLAVLIDGDNVPNKYVREMFEEIAKYGTPTFKRIYADWTKPMLAGWKKVLLENAITPIQQYAYTKGKNATDSALIIDAMDILYTGKVDGFCIVSSDSDFTRLATRLREAGMKVIGIGEKKTLNPFMTACDKFIYLEILKPRENTAPKRRETGASIEDKPVAQNEPLSKLDPEIIDVLLDSVVDIADEDGWAFLGELGSLMLKKKPDFDSRNYGFPKLLSLIKSMDMFDIDARASNKGNTRHIYIRLR